MIVPFNVIFLWLLLNFSLYVWFSVVDSDVPVFLFGLIFLRVH